MLIFISFKEKGIVLVSKCDEQNQITQYNMTELLTLTLMTGEREEMVTIFEFLFPALIGLQMESHGKSKNFA